jgi:hypothetical protein
MNLSCEAMADWIFQGNPRRYDLDASVAASREQWWGTPRRHWPREPHRASSPCHPRTGEAPFTGRFRIQHDPVQVDCAFGHDTGALDRAIG